MARVAAGSCTSEPQHETATSSPSPCFTDNARPRRHDRADDRSAGWSVYPGRGMRRSHGTRCLPQGCIPPSLPDSTLLSPIEVDTPNRAGKSGKVARMRAKVAQNTTLWQLSEIRFCRFSGFPQFRLLREPVLLLSETVAKTGGKVAKTDVITTSLQQLADLGFLLLP